MVRFSIFGIPVVVEPFFWITLVIISGANGASTPEDMLCILLFVLAGFISILVHELGHALTARRFGAYSAITLQAFGGYAAYSGVRLTRGQRFLVTAAGPGIQLLLGWAVARLITVLWLNLTLNALFFLRVLQDISIYWALLNLLPVLPLDGGRMLEAALGPERIRITLWVTIIVAAGGGLLLFAVSHSILFSLFLGMFAWQAWQALRQQPWR